MNILLCNNSYPQVEANLAALLPGHQIRSCAPLEVDKHLQGVDVLISSVASIDSAIIHAGEFGLIHQLGVGLDAIDIDAATAAGVWVANVPSFGSGNAESVAELAILLMLTLARRLDEARKNLSNGVFFKPTGMALLNKTVCIVGLGGIGRSLAVRLRPFGVHMVAVREHPENGAPPETGVEHVYGLKELHQALSLADFVVLAIPDSNTTHHLIDATALASMKKGAFLVNVARGGIVDTDALLAALESGHLAGAGLDVFWEEPADPNHPIFKQNIVATPHIAGATDESGKGIIKVIVESIMRFAAGQPPLYPANAPAALRSKLSQLHTTSTDRGIR